MNKRKYTCYLPRASSLLPHPGAHQSDAAAAAAAALVVVVVYKRISFAVSFFSFLLYTYRGFKNSSVFNLSFFFGDTFKGWESIENNHFTCVSPRLPLPPSSFSPRLSPTTTTTEKQRFLSFFLRRGGESIRRASTRTQNVLID